MAKEFVVSVPHSLGRKEAISRIKRLLSELKKVHGDQITGVKESWKDNKCEFSLKIAVFRLSGSIRVEDDRAEIRATLPVGAGRFEKRAEALIEDQATKLLS